MVFTLEVPNNIDPVEDFDLFDDLMATNFIQLKRKNLLFFY